MARAWLGSKLHSVMGIDAVIKRYWLAFLGVFIAMAAYLQADGLGQLVAGTIDDGQEVRVPRSTRPRSATTRSPNDRSAQPILSRNAFDSVTGPLDGSAQPIGAMPAAKPTNSSDPYDDEECGGVTVSMMVASDDPSWSFASLSGAEGPGLKRLGDQVGSMTVHHIGWYPDAPDALPRVWMMEGGQRCMVRSGAPGAKPAKKVSATTPPSTSSTAKKTKVPQEIASKINKISENEFVVERSALETIMENPMSFAGSLRTRPTDKGVRLSGIRSDSLFNMLGLKNGDVLKSVNGFALNDPEKALSALSKLRTASKLKFDIERGGSSKAIDVTVQ
jgi:general secretion pathway protein C